MVRLALIASQGTKFCQYQTLSRQHSGGVIAITMHSVLSIKELSVESRDVVVSPCTIVPSRRQLEKCTVLRVNMRHPLKVVTLSALSGSRYLLERIVHLNRICVKYLCTRGRPGENQSGSEMLFDHFHHRISILQTSEIYFEEGVLKASSSCAQVHNAYGCKNAQ